MRGVRHWQRAKATQQKRRRAFKSRSPRSSAINFWSGSSSLRLTGIWRYSDAQIRMSGTLLLGLNAAFERQRRYSSNARLHGTSLVVREFFCSVR